MKILKVLEQSERDDLKRIHVTHHLYCSHIDVVLQKPYCYKMHVFVSDYSEIWIHSCLPNAEDPPYQHLAKAIDYIKDNTNFLKTTSQGCLDGVKVQEYVNRLAACAAGLQSCFMKMGDCFILDKGTVDGSRNEVTDGMHRLVAYGLVSKMTPASFPIPVYLGTELPPDKIEPS